MKHQRRLTKKPSDNAVPAPVNSTQKSFARSIKQHLEGPYGIQLLRKWYNWLWLAIIGLYVSQVAALYADAFYGHGAMLLLELCITGVLWYVWFIPELLLTQVGIATINAATDEKVNEVSALEKSFANYMFVVLNISSYSIAIVVTTLILFDINRDFWTMLSLIAVGTFLGIVTATKDKSSTLALEIVQAGLIGSITKILLAFIVPVGSDGNFITRTLEHNATLFGVVAATLVLFGPARTWGLITKVWNWIIGLVSGNLAKKLVVIALIFVIWALIYPMYAMRFVHSKVTELKEAATEMRQESLDKESEAHSDSDETNVTDATVTTQKRRNKTKKPVIADASGDKWVHTGTRTCEIGWENKDFHEGWCQIGNPGPGEYQLKVKSSLVFKGQDGVQMSIPASGVSIQRWRNAGDERFASFFDTWTLVSNGSLGQVVFKTKDNAIFIDNAFSSSKNDTIYTSINFPASQENWKKYGLSGTIILELFKKQ